MEPRVDAVTSATNEKATPMTRKRRLRLKFLAAATTTGTAAVVASFASGATIASAQTQARQALSENWAGYVASGQNFSSVSGSWVQPAATSDQANDQGYSAFWVGLGGSRNQSHSLEQVGTTADYVDGQAQYYAWYELVPAGEQKLNLAIHPGDRMLGRVTVNGTTVTVYLADQTTGQAVTKTVQMTSPDTSSAEWIAEAPAIQTSAGSDQILPLADFGRVTFRNAAATANGHTGGIADSHWSTTRIDLQSQSAPGIPQLGPGLFAGGASAAASTDSAGAETSSLTGDGFSVTWQQASGGNDPGVVVIQVPYPFPAGI